MDLIERQAAIDAIGKASDELYENIKKGATFPQRQWFDGMAQAQSILENLSSAQPEIKPISYQDCANAMMMMWMDNVLTDGEYRRIMDKLNDHESGKEN